VSSYLVIDFIDFIDLEFDDIVDSVDFIDFCVSSVSTGNRLGGTSRCSTVGDMINSYALSCSAYDVQMPLVL